jgi:hypothetical protein
MKIRITIIITILILFLSLVVEVHADSDFSIIDSHVESTPADAEASIPSLVGYLTKPATTELDKVRAIYQWIISNISYDVDEYFGLDERTGRTGNILIDRTSVCSGYARLFKQMCDEGKLDAVIVSGYAKGYSYKIGDKIEGTNHAWNAVKINDKWFLLDATWGAGFINHNKEFVKRQDDFYFLAKPEEFVFSHFPEDSRWQLLSENNRISKTDFENFPFLRPSFFKMGFKIMPNHKSGLLKAFNRGTTIYLENKTDEMRFSVRAEDANGNEVDKNLTKDKIGDIYKLTINIPEDAKSGLFRVVLFSGNNDSSLYEIAKYNLLIDNSNEAETTSFTSSQIIDFALIDWE